MGDLVRVKIQRPIVTMDPDAPWMLYDSFEHTQYIDDRKVDPKIRRAMGEYYKIYARGIWVPLTRSFLFNDKNLQVRTLK